MSLGVLGFPSAVRTSKAAHWANWADCFPMIRERHQQVANIMVEQLTVFFAPPSWREVAMGETRISRTGGFRTLRHKRRWQHEVAGRRVFPRNQPVSQDG